jgi:hypothetical protein
MGHCVKPCCADLFSSARSERIPWAVSRFQAPKAETAEAAAPHRGCEDAQRKVGPLGRRSLFAHATCQQPRNSHIVRPAIMSDADSTHAVFLSHSTKDKAVVRAVAERLKADGLRVWFDDWEIRSGDSIPAKIEDGLEHSRVLVLCVSAHALGSDWAQLEAGAFGSGNLSKEL